MLLPKPWSFEQLECWVPGSIWNMEKDASKLKIYHDHELFEGQKGYANEVTGAYYAVRLPILEYLQSVKKQAMVVVFREIGDGYKLPLGSWVCGETTKAAMHKQPKIFSNLDLALEFIGKRLKIPINRWKKESVVLDYYHRQKTLFDF
jgi:DNA repair protein NreA